MCAYDTVAKEVQSPFCGLFEEGEWADYEYYLDLGKYYGYGWVLDRLSFGGSHLATY
jgi:hypothetical protein